MRESPDVAVRRIRSKDGYYKFTSIRDHLRISSKALKHLCEQLKIELVPYVREEHHLVNELSSMSYAFLRRYPEKIYKRGYRLLTESDAKRIIEAYWARRPSF